MHSRVQGNQCKFRRAIDPNGQANGAQAWVGVEHHRPYLAQAVGIFARAVGQHDRTKPGNPDLPSVRVSGELKVDREVPRAAHNNVGVVRFVDEQDYRLIVGDRAQCQLQVWLAFQNIFQAGNPDARAVALNRERLIAQYRNPTRAEAGRHTARIFAVIVIAQHGCHAQLSGKRSEDLRTRFRFFRRNEAGFVEVRARDEVTREHHQIRRSVQYLVNGIANDVSAELRVVMQIAEMRNGETREAFRQAGQTNIHAFDLEAPALVKATIRTEGERSPGAVPDRVPQEVTARQLRRLDNVHAKTRDMSFRQIPATSFVRGNL